MNFLKLTIHIVLRPRHHNRYRNCVDIKYFSMVIPCSCIFMSSISPSDNFYYFPVVLVHCLVFFDLNSIIYHLYVLLVIAELPSKILIWLLVSCYMAFPTCVESYNASSAKTPSTVPNHVVNAPLVESKEHHLLRHSRRYLASAPVQAPDGPLSFSHPPVGSMLSQNVNKNDTLASPVEGLMPPLLAEAAPAESRLPEPPFPPKVSSKSTFHSNIITL